MPEEIREIVNAIINNPIFHAVVIIAAAVIADKFLNRKILRYVSRAVQNKSEDNAGRYRTIFSVISKIITVVITFLTFLWVLQIFQTVGMGIANKLDKRK